MTAEMRAKTASQESTSTRPGSPAFRPRLRSQTLTWLCLLVGILDQNWRENRELAGRIGRCETAAVIPMLVRPAVRQIVPSHAEQWLSPSVPNRGFGA